MEQLNQKKFALASGFASVVTYLGCFLLMAVLGKEGLVKLSNLLFHGMDFSNIIRMNVPISETIIGTGASLAFWAGVGYLVAFGYNKLK